MIIPAILPGLFVILRLNLFGAWMVVLIAEAAGVGSGLGQLVMLARNTFNFTLVYFTMTLIGILGVLVDVALREMQRRALYWLPQAPRRIGEWSLPSTAHNDALFGARTDLKQDGGRGSARTEAGRDVLSVDVK